MTRLPAGYSAPMPVAVPQMQPPKPLLVVQNFASSPTEITQSGSPHRWMYAFETSRGIAWASEKTVSLNGLRYPFPRAIPREGVPGELSHWASRGFVIFPRLNATWIWSPVTGSLRRYAHLSVRGIDELGIPVGSRRRTWPQSYNSWDDGSNSLPRRGNRTLHLPPGAVSGVVNAAPTHGRSLVGYVILSEGVQRKKRACIWEDDSKPPRLLHVLESQSQSTATGINSRGEIIGLYGGPVIWHRDGSIERPVAEHPLRTGQWRGIRLPWPDRWRLQDVLQISDDGLVITREGDHPGYYVRMLYDRHHSVPVKEAIQGYAESGLGQIDLGLDGRTFLIGPDRAGVLMRVTWQPQHPVVPLPIEGAAPDAPA